MTNSTDLGINFKEYEEESRMSRFSRKAKEAPFMVGGLIGLTGIVAYSAYGLRQRKIPLSIYLIQTRVSAQGFVVAALTIGVAYSMFNEYVLPRFNKSNDTAETK